MSQQTRKENAGRPFAEGIYKKGTRTGRKGDGRAELVEKAARKQPAVCQLENMPVKRLRLCAEMLSGNQRSALDGSERAAAPEKWFRQYN